MGLFLSGSETRNFCQIFFLCVCTSILWLQLWSPYFAENVPLAFIVIIVVNGKKLTCSDLVLQRQTLLFCDKNLTYLLKYPLLHFKYFNLDYLCHHLLHGRNLLWLTLGNREFQWNFWSKGKPICISSLNSFI